MSKYVSLTDPIYEDMQISVNYLTQIVDTASFQRLRRILHPSYSPVFQTALHNRFTHSLGTYYLGTIASETLLSELNIHFPDEVAKCAMNKSTGAQVWDRIRMTFNVACLLHDVGHAPFSHTGEDFYLEDTKTKSNSMGYKALHDELIKLIDSKEFENDLKKKAAKNPGFGKPHELMSTIQGIKEYKNHVYAGRSIVEKEENREFFARCIIGLKYTGGGFKNEVRNAFISLLNGSVIDVDKLDYLNRDIYVMGYFYGKIDFKKLLKNVTIVNVGTAEAPKYELGYYHAAKYEILNVIAASDAEKQRLQNNPVSLYDGYLLQSMMKKLSQKLDTPTQKLFSYKSLTSKGHVFTKPNVPVEVRLLSDDDIIYLAKTLLKDPNANANGKPKPDMVVEEYFDRSARYRSLWESEEEYKALFGSGRAKQDNVKLLIQNVETLTDFEHSGQIEIDHDLLSRLENELQKLQGDLLNNHSSIVELTSAKQFVETLLTFAGSNNLEERYVLLKSSYSDSKFGKEDLKTMNLVTEGKERIVSDVSSLILTLQPIEQDMNKMFFLYVKKNSKNPAMKTLAKNLSDILIG